MNFTLEITLSRRIFLFFLTNCFLPIFLLKVHAQIPTFPAGFSRVLISNDLSSATAMAFAPDGRIFVAQQNGQVRIIKNGALRSTPFLRINVNSKTERGLVGLILDPNFSTNQYVYVYYTLPDGSRNRISRFTANGDLVAEGSEIILLTLDPLNAEMHNGGTLRFGKDGKLYVAVGENNVPANAQNLDNYLGKILRINPDGSVPAGNPFTSGSEARKRIWAYGFRNPFTFDIHPTSGKIFVNDVGNNNWEEVNDVSVAGGNFGWPTFEGPGNNPAYINPLFAYPHGLGDGVRGCAVTGGAFFDPSSTNYPDEYKGKYFFQDLCFRWINYMDYSNGQAVIKPFATNLGDQSIAVSVGRDGNLYYLERGTSSLYKIIYSTNTTPLVVSQPISVTTSEGQPAKFSVTATGSPTLKYQWQKNTINISGATSSTYTIASTVKQDEGSYRVVVSNNVGTVTSNAATLTVTPFNAQPTAQILKPTNGSFYQAGDVIQFAGEATDAEDGVLPASAFTWFVDLHHGTHRHDGPSIAWSVKSGSFTIPTTGETSSDVWYRLYLVVSDSKNLTDTAYVEIFPYKSNITLQTQPAGLQLTLDGQPVNTPLTVTGVEGVQRSIGVITPQTPPGKYYQFVNWAHGGSATQTIITPSEDITYTANFNEIVLRDPENPSNVVNGLNYSYYEGINWTKIPDYNTMTPIKTGTANNFDISLRNRDDNFGFKFTGYINIPYDDAFTFILKSDDGAKLLIGNTVVVDLDGNHSAWEKSGVIGLKKGLHAITILYFDKEYDQTLSLSYQGLNLPRQTVPNSVLFRQSTTAVAPTITSQPQNVYLQVGDTASFSVTASGTAPLSYQWQKENINIPGATSSTYSIINAQNINSGNYRVIVSNSTGSTISNTATLNFVLSNTPSIDTQPSDVTVTVGESATFSVQASGTGTLTYQWQKNQANVSGANSSTYTLSSAQTTDAGRYRVIVTDESGSIISNEAQLTVNPLNLTPLAEITSPSQGYLYKAGETINFSGNGTDIEDGNLPASAFSWKIDFFHTDHSHAGPSVPSGVKSGSFVIPNTGETSDNVFYRISLIVTDAQGAKDTAFRDIYPYKSTISLATQPSGLQLSLDGKTITTPYSTLSVEGMLRNLGVISPQLSGGKSYKFSEWQQGGAASQTITTPTNDITYTAVFVEDTSLPSQNGLNFSYYEGSWTMLPNFDALTPVKSGIAQGLDLSLRNRDDLFGFVFTGFLDIPVAGTYTLYLKSDDGAKLFIDDVLQIDNDGNHAAWERSVNINLTQAKHALKVIYFDKEYDQVLTLSWARTGLAKQIIPTSAFYLDKTTTPTSPSIVTPPASVTVNTGQTASFSVTANGTAPLSYQWQKNNVNISGATASTYSIPNVQTSDAGSYQVVVSNSMGTVTSNAAQLTVLSGPTIISQPTSVTVNVGQPASFSVTANGTAPLSYQWQKNNVNISGATASTYSIPNVQAADAGAYKVIISNSVGSTTSNSAQLTVNSAPAILTQPSPVSLNIGQTATFTITASGTAPLSYQWQKDGINISGANTASYSITNVQTADEGAYQVVVSNSIGSITSNAVRLTINTGQNGLNYAYYEGGWTMLPNFDALTPVKTGIAANIDLSLRNRDDFFGFVFSGFLDIPVSTAYTIYLRSDDGAKLFIDEALKIDNDGNHAAWERSVNLSLTQGKHALKVIYFDREYDNILTLSWARSGVSKQLIPASAYYTSNSLARLSTETDLTGSTEEAVTIYPNPVADKITIGIQTHIGEKVIYSVLNQMGRVVKSKTILSNADGLNLINFDVNDMINGAYIIKIQKGQAIYYKHFIVNK